MKKTLLFFFFLFTTIFYAQVSFITTCANESLNLTILDKDFIGNLNPAETTVSYFLSLDDATNNTNLIVNPTQYIGAPGVTNIYGRVNNNGNITTNYFSLTALPPINVTVSHTPIICSEETATLTVNASGGIGSYEYSLNGGPYTSNNYFKFLIAGTYKIDVTDGVGICTVSIDHTIIAPPRLNATATTVNQNTTIIAEGGTEPYQYSIDGINYQSGNVFSDLPVGIQPISVRDAKGCSVFTTIAIGDTDFPLGSGGMILKNVSCWGTAALRAIGYGGEPPYLYSINGGQSFQTSDTFDNLNAGIYPIAIKDSKNTIINNLSIELLPFVPVTATVTAINASSCTNNGSINIVANGGQIPHYYSIDGGKTYTSNNTFPDLPAGNYTVLVKDSSECISPVITATIKQDPQLSATALHTELLCAQDKTTLTINATGGEAPYQYAINNGIYSLNNTYNNFSPGAYQIKVKDAIGCITVIEHIIAQPTPVNPVFVIDGRTLTINVQGGTAPYQYSVDASGFQSMNVFTNLSSGVHFIKVKDSKGCQSIEFPFTIEDPTPLVSTVAITKNVDCTSNASIVINAKGGQSPYSYSLNGGQYQSSNIFNDLTAGTYFVTVKDVSGSETQVYITVNPYVDMVVATAIRNVNCYGYNDASIQATVTGGIAPYMYSIGNGYVTSNTFNSLSANQYVLTVKDAANCIITKNIILSQPSALLLSEVVTNSTSSTNNDGVITVSATGGVYPYTYSITDNSGLPDGSFQLSNVFTGLKAGSYGVQVNDANGCINYKTNIIVANNPDLSHLSATVNITPITCNNSTGTITVIASGGSGSYVYSLNNNPNYSTSNVFSNLSGGNYTVSVRDSQNAVTSVTATIISYIPLSTNAVLTKNIDCLSNATINVEVSGGKTPYKYSLDNGVTYTASPIFTNLGAGSYFIRVKDALDCTVITNSIILEQPAPLSATATSTKIVDCSVNYNSTIVITATGGQAPYLYAVNSSTNYQTSNVYSGAAPGIHTVNVKDANGCMFTTTLVIDSPSALILTTLTTESTFCGGKSSVTINPIGGQAPYSYSFNGGNSYFPTNTSELSAGGYTLFAKDSNGCIATIYVTVEYSSVPLSTISTITNPTSSNSNDGSIILEASGGTVPYTYTLLNSNNNVIVPAQSYNTFNNLAPGTYGVIVTDAKGCSSSLTQITISSPSTLLATTTISQPSCVNPFGIIIIDAMGGTVPYQYSIDNGATYSVSNTFMVTQAGYYNIVVRDSQNDTYSSVIAVKPLDPLFINATVVSNASCISNGIITAIASGGQAPYAYSINGSAFQNNNVFNNLPAGFYTIEVKDTNGCIANVTMTLTQPEPISASVTVDNQTMIVTAAGGTGNYQYSLDGSIFQSSNIFTVVNYGTYNVFVRDQNGCMVVVNTTLNPPSPVIEGKDVITIEFKPGQTLGNLVIDGQNIKWYSNQNPLSGKTTKLTEVTLPLTTVLVDGTTYYASQTINGIESIERLAVTTKLSGSLSTPDVVLPNFRFYPNPVHHTLTIDNVSTINEIEIISVSGKSILHQKVNNTHSEIDLSNVSSGFYFLKVTSEGKVKTIKIVKK